MNARAWRFARKTAALLVFLVLANGCRTMTPVGVSRVGERQAYQQINQNILNARGFSSVTTAVLHRHDLRGVLDDDPGGCVQKLHAIACRDDRRDALLALAEICFALGGRDRSIMVSGVPIAPRDCYVAAAIYAELYLLGPGKEAAPSSFAREFRLACDLYNRSLARVLSLLDMRSELQHTVISLPVGRVELGREFYDLPWPRATYESVISADEYVVRGLTRRNREGGLGAPIVALRKRSSDFPVGTASAGTVFLRVEGGVQDLTNAAYRASFGVYSAMKHHEVVVNDQTVPIEADLTTQLAYVLEDPKLWKLGFQMFRRGLMPYPPGLYPAQPYEHGKIPVVLVHGTMSSPVWWAEMMNTLASDERLRSKFQFWLYLYDSGKPLIFSARNLRDSIEAQVRKFDPDGRDAALQNMVVIGHSQGGLLTRMAAVDSGETVIHQITGKSLDELKLAPQERALVVRYAAFTPMPQIKRVVFIATPHRGSHLAFPLARRLARWFIQLPQDVLKTGAELMTIIDKTQIPGTLSKNMPTSIDGMSPENPVLQAVAKLPIPAAIKAHSIIAIDGDEPPPDGDDGVVQYTSAHLDGVASELVVRSPHSCQSHPATIEEVRRILLVHLGSPPYPEGAHK